MMGNGITLDTSLYERKTIGNRLGWCMTTKVDGENWKRRAGRVIERKPTWQEYP